MDHARSAEVQVLLEGVPLPAGKVSLLRYARHEGADVTLLSALMRLPARRYSTLDEVGEAIAPVRNVPVQQPRAGTDAPHHRVQTGPPPGGAEYTNPHPESGFVREKGPAA